VIEPASVTIRPATGGDVAAIDALLQAAFPSPAEARLVQQLCTDGDMVLTLVADDTETGVLAGVAVWSRMRVDAGGKAIPAVTLAPVATAPSHRRGGVGEALITTGHAMLARAGYLLDFVLGDPAYYGRFGYAADLARGFASPYAGDWLMAHALRDRLVCGERGQASHAAAFAALGVVDA